MTETTVVLLTSLDDEAIAPYAGALGDPIVVRDLRALEKACVPEAVLLSFAVGLIVPSAVLNWFGAAYNLHAASPDYPGRDPHHFATYDGVRRYGATLHLMTAKVDDGPIVEAEYFDVPEHCRPLQLLLLANAAALRILERTGVRLAAGERLAPLLAVNWGPNKRSRADFLAMCRIDPAISDTELARRIHAFDGEGRNNLNIELHGRIFRLTQT